MTNETNTLSARPKRRWWQHALVAGVALSGLGSLALGALALAMTFGIAGQKPQNVMNVAIATGWYSLATLAALIWYGWMLRRRVT